MSVSAASKLDDMGILQKLEPSSQSPSSHTPGPGARDSEEDPEEGRAVTGPAAASCQPSVIRSATKCVRADNLSVEFYSRIDGGGVTGGAVLKGLDVIQTT